MGPCVGHPGLREPVELLSTLLEEPILEGLVGASRKMSPPPRTDDDAFPRHARSGIGDGLPEPPELLARSPLLLGAHIRVVQLESLSLLRGDDVVRHVGDRVGGDILMTVHVSGAEAVADLVQAVSGQEGEGSTHLVDEFLPPLRFLSEVTDPGERLRARRVTQNQVHGDKRLRYRLPGWEAVAGACRGAGGAAHGLDSENVPREGPERRGAVAGPVLLADEYG